jgi:hypothetical protein
MELEFYYKAKPQQPLFFLMEIGKLEEFLLL